MSDIKRVRSAVYGKRTDVDAYRLQSRGGKGVISMKTGSKIGKVTSISLVDDTTEMMVISQFGKITAFSAH